MTKTGITKRIQLIFGVTPQDLDAFDTLANDAFETRTCALRALIEADLAKPQPTTNTPTKPYSKRNRTGRINAVLPLDVEYTTVRLDAPFAVAFKTECEKRGVSVSAGVRKLLLNFVDVNLDRLVEIKQRTAVMDSIYKNVA